eukprot:1148409-Alexandrium_andersonii.AAC.1
MALQMGGLHGSGPDVRAAPRADRLHVSDPDPRDVCGQARVAAEHRAPRTHQALQMGGLHGSDPD